MAQRTEWKTTRGFPAPVIHNIILIISVRANRRGTSTSLQYYRYEFETTRLCRRVYPYISYSFHCDFVVKFFHRCTGVQRPTVEYLNSAQQMKRKFLLFIAYKKYVCLRNRTPIIIYVHAHIYENRIWARVIPYTFFIVSCTAHAFIIRTGKTNRLSPMERCFKCLIVFFLFVCL